MSKKGFPRKDHTGERFGKLVIVSEAEPYQSAKRILRRVNCVCDCGKTTTVHLYTLKPWRNSSCGCGKNKWPTTHKMTKTRTYRVWWGVRCRGLGLYARKDYADKGITVCERWLTFENFLADMGERPKGRMTIERVDNSKGYSPENCVWAGYDVQARNKCNNRKLDIDGVSKCITDVARDSGMNLGTLAHRIKMGATVAEAIANPIKRRPTEYEGEIVSLKSLTKRFGRDYNTVAQRLDRGWDLERALKCAPLIANTHRRKVVDQTPPHPVSHSESTV